MKLVHGETHIEIELRENSAAVWVIEKPRTFQRCVWELQNQIRGEDGGFVLSEQNKIIKIKDSIELITDFFTLRFDDKRLQSKVLKQLSQVALDECYEETLQIRADIQRYFMNLTDKLDIPMEDTGEVDLTALLKLMNITFEESKDSLLEYLAAYLKLNVSLFPKMIAVFVNLKQYLSEIELSELYQFAAYEKIPLLLIENMETRRQEGERYVILDKDDCVI